MGFVLKRISGYLFFGAALQNLQVCKCFLGGPTSATLRENPEGSFNAGLDL